MVLDNPRELAGKGPPRATGRGRRRTVDEIGDGLGLGEVDAVVEECAQREFAGPGRAGPELADALEHHARDHGAAVALKLEDIFAGERSGSLEAQRQTIVDHRSGPFSNCAKVATRGAGTTPEHASRDRHDEGPRHPHDCDAAPSGRSRDCRNRIAGTGWVHWPA